MRSVRVLSEAADSSGAGAVTRSAGRGSCWSWSPFDFAPPLAALRSGRTGVFAVAVVVVVAVVVAVAVAVEGEVAVAVVPLSPP